VQRWVTREGLDSRRLGKRAIRISASSLREWIAQRSGRPCPDMAGPWLTLGDVAHLLNVSDWAVADWARRRGLPVRHLGGRLVRIVPSELAAWLEAQPRGDAR
jgi:excisionase family DNA binding protein